MSRRLPWIIALLTIVALLGVVPTAGAAADQEGASIRLEAGTFDPARGERLDLPPGLTIAGYAAGQRGAYLVQFSGPVHQEWKDAVEALGADVLAYVPDYAFKVRMTPAAASRVESLDAVSWVGVFQPGYKISPAVADEGVAVYRVRVERGADAGRATAAVARSGATVLSRDGGVLLVGADRAQVEAVARVVDVAWIEPYVLPERHNEYGAGAIIGAASANANGYDGSSQVVAVADTGLGDGTASGAHPDIPASRVVSVNNWPGVTDLCFQTIVDDGPRDVDSGHGTHVSGSVLSDGGPGGEGRGAAPAASLVFQATENYAQISAFCQVFGGWPADGYFLTGLPADLGDLYGQAYSDGARVHANSWGSNQAGAYTVDSANTDTFVWGNPDLAITFSSGNAGVDANANGVVDDDSIGSPATAKNVLTVGASEGDRQGDYQCDTGLGYTSHDAYQPGETCSSMGGQNILGTAGQRWGFPAEPLASDVSAGDAEQMAPFSSRGPTDDGRIKPDVVAPGTWILSGYSGMFQEGYGDPVNPQNGAYQWDGWGMPVGETYKYMGGTSMANPIAAGGAAVVRDFYQKAEAHSASAALVKATLINSAEDLLDENNDGADDNDFPIPNVHEGWGRIDLVAATDGSHQWIDDAGGLATGGSDVRQFSVQTSGTPFKVSLVWSDFPSTEVAAVNLVNDLDLVVTAPGGAQYRGNVFSGGWSVIGGSADATNNVENVYVSSPAAGVWTVTVSGANVPMGPQPYALVVDGGFGTANTPPAVSIESPADGATVSGTEPVVIAATDAEDAAGSLTVEWNVDGGAWQPAAYDAGTDRYEASWDTTTVADGGHVVNARAVDSAGAVGSDASNVTVQNAQVATLHVGDLDGSRTSAKGGKWNATVTVTVHDAAEAAAAGATVDGTWSNGASGSGSCVTDGAGSCSITVSNVSRNTSSVTFTVDGVARGSDVYSPGANHDPDGDSDGTTIVVPKSPPPDPGGLEIHVGDLDGSASPGNRRWTAAVTITVHDDAHAPVAGAAVSGTWSNGARGGGSCTTGASGTCTVSKDIKNNTASVTFSVTDVVLSGATYTAANHDPDGDSDGTTITVAGP